MYIVDWETVLSSPPSDVLVSYVKKTNHSVFPPYIKSMDKWLHFRFIFFSLYGVGVLRLTSDASLAFA